MFGRMMVEPVVQPGLGGDLQIAAGRTNKGCLHERPEKGATLFAKLQAELADVRIRFCPHDPDEVSSYRLISAASCTTTFHREAQFRQLLSSCCVSRRCRLLRYCGGTAHLEWTSAGDEIIDGTRQVPDGSSALGLPSPTVWRERAGSLASLRIANHPGGATPSDDLLMWGAGWFPLRLSGDRGVYAGVVWIYARSVHERHFPRGGLLSEV
jgi:hypothetical protein